MALYEITYKVLPAGVGADDYEPADLEQRVERYELADPEPGTGYGPPQDLVQETVNRQLNGAHAIILRTRLVD